MVRTIHKQWGAGLAGISCLLALPLGAQILRDGSIGPDVTVQPSGPHFVIGEHHGQQIGTNLLHSFAEFNILRHETATFTGNASIQNVISRVTGNNISTINGQLRSTISGADIYLLNPNGILFKNRATIDIDGGFHASTARTLHFGNGEILEVSVEGRLPILSTAHPDAFGDLGDSTQRISIKGSQIVNAGDIEFAAGGIDLMNDAFVSTRPNGAVAGGDVILSATEDITLAGTAPSPTTRIETLAGSHAGGGTIRVNAADLRIEGGSALRASTDTAHAGGDIVINASNSVTITAQHRPRNRSKLLTITRGSADAGSIFVTTGNLHVNRNAAIHSQSIGLHVTGSPGSIDVRADTVLIDFGAGIISAAEGAATTQAGTVQVVASESIELSGYHHSRAFPSRIDSATRSAGQGGTVIVNAPDVVLSDGAKIAAASTGAHASGNAGNVFVFADRLRITGLDPDLDESWQTRIGTNSARASAGDAGTIEIVSSDISIIDGGRISSAGEGAGAGGSIRILAGNPGASMALLSGGAVLASAAEHASGDVSISGFSSLTIEHGRIVVRNEGSAEPGSVALESLGSVLFAHASIDAENLAPGSTSTSGIVIHAERIELSDSAIRGSAVGDAEAASNAGGTIELVATGDLQLVRSTVDSRVRDTRGSAGDVLLSGANVSLEQDSVIATRSENGGNAGRIAVNATEQFLLSNSTLDSTTNTRYVPPEGRSEISVSAATFSSRSGHIHASTAGEADAGAIRVVVDQLSLLEGSTIQASASGNGNAGDIDMLADTMLLTNGTTLSSASTGAGAGGTIMLRGASEHTSELQLAEGSAITADGSGSGASGSILISGFDSVILDDAMLRISNGGLASAGTVGISGIGSITLSSSAIEAENHASSVAGGAGIVVVADSLSMNDSHISANASGSGDGAVNSAGSIRVVLALDGSFDHSTITSRAQQTSGSAGDIEIAARELSIVNGSLIASNSNTAGAAGTVRLNASGTLSLTDAMIDTSTNSAATSEQGGYIAISADALHMDSASISADTGGEADAGAISVAAGVVDMHSGSRISTSTSAAGRAGQIDISAQTIALRSGAAISSSSSASGNAGDIWLEATDSISLSDAHIDTEAQSAYGGNIVVNARDRLHLNNSTISTSVAAGAGNGGTIAIDPQLVLLEHSAIVARAHDGKGGSISIEADALITSADSTISASSSFGVDGEVLIVSPDVNASAGIDALVTDYRAPPKLRPACAARGTSAGSLVAARYRGLPLSPENLMLAHTELSPAQMDGQAAAQPLATLSAALRSGAYREATEALVRMQSTAQSPDDQLFTLRGLAQLQQLEGDYAASVDTLNAAWQLAENTATPVNLIQLLDELANAHVALGDVDRAEASQTRAIKISGSAGSSADSSTVMNNFGNHQALQRKYREALVSYAEAASLARQGGDLRNEAAALANAARIAQLLNDTEQLHVQLNLAEAVVQRMAAGLERAALAVNIGRTFFAAAAAADQGDAETLRAYALFTLAIADSSSAPNRRMLSFALGNLGELYAAQHRDDEALFLFRRALSAAEQAGADELLHRWHWNEGRILWRAGRGAAAVAAFRRAVSILEQSNPEILASYGAVGGQFYERIAPAYVHLIDALIRASDMQSNRADSNALLSEARATVELLRGAELRDYFGDECVAAQANRQLTPEDVSRTAAVIYPIVFPDRIELLIGLHSGLQHLAVPVRSSEVAASIAQLHRAMQDPATTSHRLPALRLYKWVIEPLLPILGSHAVDTLVFVPGREMRSVPFAALHDGTAYLAERYAVAMSPGLTLTDPRPMNNERLHPLLVGLSEATDGMSALPGVPRELAAVQSLIGGQILVNEDFTVDALEKRIHREAPTVLHIASHGLLAGDSRSSFLMTHDGPLSLTRLEHLVGLTRFSQQPVELLVLSACETAAGDDRAALGLAGVGIRAGAHSAVGSLWRIHDEATAQFMEGFYRHLREPGTSRAQALRAAQTGMLASPRFSHPFFWSGFVLINNWL